MTETVQTPVQFQYCAHSLGQSTLYCASSIRRTVQFQYRAHIYEEYNDQSTAYGTTDNFFQDHHTLHSYNWKNDNKTGQSSTSTARNMM